MRAWKGPISRWGPAGRRRGSKDESRETPAAAWLIISRASAWASSLPKSRCSPLLTKRVPSGRPPIPEASADLCRTRRRTPIATYGPFADTLHVHFVRQHQASRRDRLLALHTGQDLFGDFLQGEA